MYSIYSRYTVVKGYKKSWANKKAPLHSLCNRAFENSFRHDFVVPPLSKRKPSSEAGRKAFVFELCHALCYNKKNGYDRMNPQEMEPLEAYCTGYKQFLDAGKTERECVERAVALAKDAGFRPYERGMELKP